MNDWMTDDILVLKALRRKYESLWRKTRLTVHFDMYSEFRYVFKIVDTFLGRNKQTTFTKV